MAAVAARLTLGALFEFLIRRYVVKDLEEFERAGKWDRYIGTHFDGALEVPCPSATELHGQTRNGRLLRWSLIVKHSTHVGEFVNRCP
jgi:hypothetical protein